MRAVVLREYGGPEVLRIEDVPDPEPGPDEVLVDVTATALNRGDLLQRRGMYPSPPTPGGLARIEIPGLEISGVVATVGSQVRMWQSGDHVMAVTGAGGYAERTVVHERMLIPVPDSVPVADAAAIPEAFITAWDALVVQGGLTSGRTALVHAGGSGVGTAAIQVAKAIGARVIVTCSAPKVDRCVDLGADRAIDYANDDFVAACAELTDGRGVDVVLDVIGGDYTNRNLDALVVQGTVVQVGAMGGGTTPMSLGSLMLKRAHLVGTLLRPRPLEEKIAAARRFADEVVPLFDTGACRPVIDRRYPIDDIAAAHEYLADNVSFGKVLIDVAGPR